MFYLSLVVVFNFLVEYKMLYNNYCLLIHIDKYFKEVNKFKM